MADNQPTNPLHKNARRPDDVPDAVALIVLDDQTFNRMKKGVIEAAATDDYRPTLTHVLFEAVADDPDYRIMTVSTDSYRMVVTGFDPGSPNVFDTQSEDGFSLTATHMLGLVGAGEYVFDDVEPGTRWLVPADRLKAALGRKPTKSSPRTIILLNQADELTVTVINRDGGVTELDAAPKDLKFPQWGPLMPEVDHANGSMCGKFNPAMMVPLFDAVPGAGLANRPVYLRQGVLDAEADCPTPSPHKPIAVCQGGRAHGILMPMRD